MFLELDMEGQSLWEYWNFSKFINKGSPSKIESSCAECIYLLNSIEKEW